MDGANARSRPLLMAEDDADDRMMVERALREQRLVEDVRFVGDGQELMEYLRREGAYAEVDANTAPLPALIVLDLNMPRKDGRAALSELKTDRRLRQIPVVVLTTSRAEEDVVRSYDLGVSSFVVKPSGFHALIEYMKLIGQYWFTVVQFPPSPEAFETSRLSRAQRDRVAPTRPSSATTGRGAAPKENAHGESDSPVAD